VTGLRTLRTNRHAFCPDASRTRAPNPGTVEAEGGGFNPTLLFEGGGAGAMAVRGGNAVGRRA
jgi:hypothetical protein